MAENEPIGDLVAYSDLYKDAYGVRPLFTPDWKSVDEYLMDMRDLEIEIDYPDYADDDSRNYADDDDWRSWVDDADSADETIESVFEILAELKMKG